MTQHACFALPPSALDIVVIEDSKPMQGILRTVFHALHVRRIRFYDDFKIAVEAMVREAPNLIILDWRIGRTTGYRFLRTLRKRTMGSLGVVPVLVITAHATATMLDRAMSAGAHAVLVKPLSPNLIYKRIEWLVGDRRRMVDGPNGSVVIEGMADTLRVLRARLRVNVAQLEGVDMAAAARKGTAPPPAPLGFGETVKKRTGPKLPSETLKRMPKLNHFAALRGGD
jgi:two-component system phosphate regulon response regulator PhoB